jgi:peptide/nickel transport system permease protein
LLYITPGDPAALLAGDQATPEDLARIRASLGLDQPFLTQFLHWIWRVLHGDLGNSIFANEPVTRLILQRLEPTVSLMIFSLILALVFAIPAGVVAAWRRGRPVDKLIMLGTVFGFSVPVFVVGYLLTYAVALKLGLLPTQGYSQIEDGVLPWLAHLVLPSITLALSFSALIARMTRTAMLEVLKQDYVRTAKAKGLPQSTVLFRHALKNAAPSILTVIGIAVALLIGGAVVTESVFAIPGLGRLLVDSILKRDFPVIQGIVLLCSGAYVVVNLIIDLLYTVVDPRIQL